MENKSMTINERLSNEFVSKEYDENKLVEFLEENGYTDIVIEDVIPSNSLKDTHKIKKFTLNFYGTVRTMVVTFLSSNKKINSITLMEGGMNDLKSSKLGLGCFLLIFIVIGLIIWLISSTISDSDYDSDDDCNRSYIEYDYNGDGEKDAEDYRIQTNAC